MRNSGNGAHGHGRGQKACGQGKALARAGKRAACAFAFAFAWAHYGIAAYAKGKGKEKDPFGFVEGKDNGMFNGLIETVNQTGASANKLMMALGAVSAVLALGGVGLMIMLIKNSNKREENKSWLLAIVAGGMMLFGSASFAGILYQMGQSV